MIRRCLARFALALAVAAAAASAPAGAFQLEGQRWPTPTTTYFINIPGANGLWNSAFAAAMADWNAATPFTFQSVPGFQDPCDSSANGAAFSATVCGSSFGPLIVAITLLNWDPATNIFVHAGTVFNSSVAWSVYSGPLQGELIDFRRVAVHELGHGLGLAHESAVPAIMNPVVGNIEAPTADDIAGVEAIYGARPPALVSAVLPSSRSVSVDAAATVFATMINAGGATATACRVAPHGFFPGSFSYQTTDPATNRVSGNANTPADIAGGASQSFILTLTPSSPLAPSDIAFDMSCQNAADAVSITGVNTLLLSASSAPVPDVVALAATVSNDGVLAITSPPSAAFAVATVNVGASGTITASADTGAASLPLTLTLCQTDPASGVCLAAPAPSVTTAIAASATPTFAIFATAHGAIPFSPASSRIFVRFRDGGGVVRGSTSVAVRNDAGGAGSPAAAVLP